jgi:anaerobic magnesium-protoporphyrin IX monomethyl ester cyclase
LRVLLISTAHPLEENPLPPLSLAYLAGALQREGIEVQILDFLVTRYHPRKIRRKLEEYRPHLVGVTCVTLNYPAAARMLKVCKDFDPSIVTVIGGPHVTFTAEQTLLRAPWIDVVAIGEGDTTVIELAKAVAGASDFSSVAGIAFADGASVVKTDSRPLIEDLDRLPQPARHLLPLSRYRALQVPCTVITSRGCPYGCVFCSAHLMFGRRVRFRAPGLVVDEIEALYRDFGFAQINIVDDTFTVNHKHTSQVCEEILRRNLRVNWTAYARVDNMTPDLVALMKRAGCHAVLFGIESADEKILKTIGKGITPEDMRRGVKIATEAGLSVYTSFILGLPGESPETARNSLEFADELNNNYGATYSFHILAPLPGTRLYDRAADYGIRILSRNWAHYDANRVITETATMSREMSRQAMARFDEIIDEAWKEVRRRAEAGDVQFIQRLQKGESQQFVWKLLQGDVIEKLGKVSTATPREPVETDLALRLSRRLALPFDTVQPQVDLLVQNGLLQLGQGTDGLHWQWSSSQCAVPPGQVVP